MASHPELAQTRHIETTDGRRLRAEVAGAGRRGVLVQVGSPNAGVLYHDWVQDAAGRGLTLITYDRPGYRGSSGQLGRVVADCAAGVRRLSEVVGFERCVVWGFSGRGPHALACGALLDGLVAAVATIGSPAPFDAAGLDFLAGRSDEDREDHELFLSDRAAWERHGEQQRKDLLAMSAGELAEQWSAGKSEPMARCSTANSASGCIERPTRRWRPASTAGLTTTSRCSTRRGASIRPRFRSP
jgi:pimeloyl-ACP methyl ester carboxylesterase